MANKVSTRLAFGEALKEIGHDERVFVLDSDVSKSTHSYMFKQKYPERFINIGIAEGNMIGVAAGLATCGNIAFACSFANFAVLRACEQIRNSVCYPNLNVKIIGTHSGLSGGKDGASHHALEDVAIMRSFPNMKVICPADATSTKAAIKAAASNDGPFYIRIRRTQEPVIYEEGYAFEIGKANVLKEGADVALIASGSTVHLALIAADILKAQGIEAKVIDMHTIKPIDKEAIISAAEETGAIVACEEHSVIGGLGSAVAEVVAQTMPVPMRFVGTRDTFGKSGDWEELKEKFGITQNEIVKKALEAIKAKKNFKA